MNGWAAWRYHRGLGSKDIDIIFPDATLLEPFLRDYYRHNGYERQPGLIESSYRKPIKVDSREFYIELDAAPITKGLPFHEDGSIDLPYTLLQDHHQPWQVGSEEVLMPTVELLLLQKVKAHRDRSWNLGHTSPDPVREQFLRGKIQKDTYDIRNLVPHVANWAAVARIADSRSCRGLVRDTLRDLGIQAGL